MTHAAPQDHGHQGDTDTHSLEAERALLGSLLLNPALQDTIDQLIAPGDYYKPAHTLIHQAARAVHQRGQVANHIAVAQHLAETSQLGRVGGGSYLYDLIETVPLVGDPSYYAKIVRDSAHNRAIDVLGVQLRQTTRMEDPARRRLLITQIRDQIDTLLTEQAPATPDRTELDVYLDVEEEPYDWLVPGLIERQDRTILTGEEGKGKSTFLRQFGVQVASGIHPFTLQPIRPVRTLLVDLENTDKQSRRKLRELRGRTDRYQPDPGFHIHCRPEGLDLTGPTDTTWLSDLVHEIRPDILIIGPIYKMASGDPTEEQPAKAVVTFLDRLRTQFGCALLLEAHTPLPNGKATRPKRPYGASLWLRWPEFGIHLSEHGEITHWRGMRDERAWPWRLRRGGAGGAWPWIVAEMPREGIPEPQGDHGGAQAAPDARVAALVAEMDRLEIPIEQGRPTARKRLQEAGVHFDTNALADAIAYRRVRDLQNQHRDEDADGGEPDGLFDVPEH